MRSLADDLHLLDNLWGAARGGRGDGGDVSPGMMSPWSGLKGL